MPINFSGSRIFTDNNTKNLVIKQGISGEAIELSTNKVKVLNNIEILGNINTFTGSATLASVDIDSGTIDGATIATSDITVGSGKTLNVSDGTLTLANDQISGDKVEGGTIASITISQLGGAMDCNNQTMTNVDINSGAIDGATIGASSAAAATFTQINLYHASGNSTITKDVNKITLDPHPAGGDISGTVVIKGDLIVDGTTTTINSTNVDISDSILTLNSNLASNVAASLNAGFIVNRGSNSDVSFLWDETNNRWTIGSETFVAGTVIADVTGNVTGNVSGSSGSCTGNAATVTNGVYTTSSVTVLSDVTSVGSGAIITSAERTKLSGIETAADVTDATNVAAAGAVMNSGDETIAGAKTFSTTIVGSINGNAATATTLANARTINGVSFNGSDNITTVPVSYNSFALKNSGFTDLSNTNLTTTGWQDATSYVLGKTLSSSNSFVKMEFKVNFISSPEADQTLSFRVRRSTGGGAYNTTIFTDENIGSNMGVTIRSVYNGTYIDNPGNTTVSYQLQFKREGGTEIDTPFGIIGNSSGDYIFLQELYA